MDQPRFLADHDLIEAIVTGVLRREPSIIFIRTRDVGMHDRPDPELLEYAAGENLIVVSHDFNTMAGHAYDRIEAGRPMPGLFLVKQREPIGPVIDSLVEIWSASRADEWASQVMYLPL